MSTSKGTSGSSRSDFVVAAKWRLVRKIGSGSFGDIYLGVAVSNGEEVAVKLESVNARHPQLLYESKVYKFLQVIRIFCDFFVPTSENLSTNPNIPIGRCRYSSNQMVRFRRREKPIQRSRNGFTGAEPRRSIQFLRPSVHNENSPHARRTNADPSRIHPLEKFYPSRHQARQLPHGHRSPLQ